MIIRKKELVDIISEKTGLKKYEVKEVIESLGETIYEELKKDNTIIIKKLFKIEPVIREKRQRYNPATGECDTVEKRKSVKMTPTETLKLIIRDAPSETQIKDDLERLALERKIASLQSQKEKLEAKMNKGV